MSATLFQGAKFQPTAPATTENTTEQTVYDFWSSAKDYRFQAGDQVDIYRMQENASGVIEWHNKLGRALNGPSSATDILVNGLAMGAAIAITTLF